MKRICVFAGSNLGSHPAYRTQARRLGEAIVKHGFELIYGGSKAGLMGIVADRVLELGGRVIGVMPTTLFRSLSRGEVVHTGLTELVEVKDMHERKATMGNLSDAYVALPGGYGTLEELFEVISWAQLGIHHKPIGLLNVEEYYVPLMRLVDHAVQAGFVPARGKDLLITADDAATLVDRLQAAKGPLSKPPAGRTRP
ncbi:MAG: TIGR00730 family Rossman fold protein, partial [Alicyclobacillaceae bacterium]|nr:TIGR00730 family Rossman fold protein [Alicyclobacillaceae bacterium]